MEGDVVCFAHAVNVMEANIGPKEAIRGLTDQLKEKYSYVVEADIKGFFDHLNHGWLMKMLDLRIGDGTIKRYTWNGFKEMSKQYGIPRPRIIEKWWIKSPVQYSLEFV